MTRKLDAHDSQVMEKYSSCLDDLHFKIHYMIYLMIMAKKLGDRRERGSDGYTYPLEPIIRTNESVRRLWEQSQLLSTQYTAISAQISLASQKNIRKLKKEQIEDLCLYREKIREHVIDVGRRCYDRTKEFGPEETIIIEAKNGKVKFAERKVAEDPGEEKRKEESKFLNIDYLEDPSEGPFKWIEEEWMEYILLGTFNMERRRARRHKEGVEIEALSTGDDNCKWIEMKEVEEKKKKEEEKKRKEEERRKKKRGRPLKKSRIEDTIEVDQNNNEIEDPMERLKECNNCIKYLQMEIEIIKEIKEELLMLNSEVKSALAVRLPDRIQEMNLMLNQLPLRAESIFKEFTNLKRSDQCEHCHDEMKKKLMTIDLHLERVQKMIDKLYDDYGTTMKGLLIIDSTTFSLENGFKVELM